MERVAIVGLGLIGGSLGLALRRALPGVEVLGVARRTETAEAALKIGAATAAGTELAAVSQADLVVLCCPHGVQAQVMEELVTHLAEGARVTDVGSVKSSVVDDAARILDRTRNGFLGGHPMAGKEVTGIENADADLFTGRPWVLTPTGRTPLGAFSDWVEAIEEMGARPMTMSPAEHDRAVALVSHLPFMGSAAYLLAVRGAPGNDAALELASSGFRDYSRLGAGDPDMYAAIAEANREELLSAFASLHGALDRFEAALAREDYVGLGALFREAREVRAAWERTRG